MTKNTFPMPLGIAVVAGILFFNNCGNSGSSGQVQNLPVVNIVSNAPPLSITGAEHFVMSVGVGCGYVNEPCVSVTICQPGTSACVTVGNILLDTGSYGLRVFSSLLAPLGLVQEVDAAGNSVAECQSYADGSSDWGPVVRADVIMGGEAASNIPIQSIDSNFGSVPSDCKNLDVNPGTSNFNGILGVGHFVYDCGGTCAPPYTNNRIYFNCNSGSTSCDKSGAAIAEKFQVINPAAALGTDNNGVIVQMPAIPMVGASGVTGWLVFGIGTQAMNTPPAGVVAFAADYTSGNFATSFNGTNYPAFIDSGSNGLYFPGPSSLTKCTDIAGFYCPDPPQVLSATQQSSGNKTSQSIQFEIQNADVALSSSNQNNAFNNLAGPFSNEFDWGFPFFLGRTIYVGFESATSPLGTGPLWAY